MFWRSEFSTPLTGFDRRLEASLFPKSRENDSDSKTRMVSTMLALADAVVIANHGSTRHIRNPEKKLRWASLCAIFDCAAPRPSK